MPSSEAIAEYELVLMLDPETPEGQRETLTGDVRGRIEAAGELRHGETWGVRKLAYEVQKRNEADYRFFRFQAESSLLDELDHSLKIADGVLRFRVFSVDPRTPIAAPPPPVQAARPPRESRGGRPRHSGGDDRGRGDRDGDAAGAGTDESPQDDATQAEDSGGAQDTSAAASPEAPRQGDLSSEAAPAPAPEAADESADAPAAEPEPADADSAAGEGAPAADESAADPPASDDAAEPKASE